MDCDLTLCDHNPPTLQTDIRADDIHVAPHRRCYH